MTTVCEGVKGKSRTDLSRIRRVRGTPQLALFSRYPDLVVFSARDDYASEVLSSREQRETTGDAKCNSGREKSRARDSSNRPIPT